MARLKTCPYCGESIPKDSPNIPYKGRTYHKKCFDKYTKEIKQKKDKELSKKTKKGRKAKPKVELKNGLSEDEYAEKKKYFDYLRQLTDNDLSAKVYALTEDYIKKYNFTYTKMYKTLYYLKEIKQKDLTGDIVGIIPYYYSEAENYYNEIDKIGEENKKIDLSKMYQTETVIIHPNKGRTGHRQSLFIIDDIL